MSDYAMKFKENELISIEREDEPGKFYRCLVIHINKDGSPKLVLQDSYTVDFNKDALKEYMRDQGITQGLLASILNISRTTVNRYVSGARQIPQRHLKKLGIVTRESELQVQAHQEQVYAVLMGVRALNKKVDILLPPKEKE